MRLFVSEVTSLIMVPTLKPKDRERLKRNERQRHEACVARSVTGKNESKSVTMCLVDETECTNRTNIEDV